MFYLFHAVFSIQTQVTDIHENVARYNEKVDDVYVERERAPNAAVQSDDFRDDTCNVTRHNQNRERQAHSLRRSCFIRLANVDRPRAHEAN